MNGESRAATKVPIPRTTGRAPTHEEIAREAYFLWERQGRPEGRDGEFWQQAERKLREQQARGTSPGTRTILLVDDEPICRHFMALFLRYEGYVVIEASSGEEARRFLEAGNHTDLLITDFQMQGMNGEDLAGWLYQKDPETPALLVSGLPDIQDRIQLDHPKFRCMTKPCDPHELTEAVAGLLTGHVD